MIKIRIKRDKLSWNLRLVPVFSEYISIFLSSSHLGTELGREGWVGTSGTGPDGRIALLLEPVVVASVIYGNSEAQSKITFLSRSGQGQCFA